MDTDFKAKIHLVVEVGFTHFVEPLVLDTEDGVYGRPSLKNKDTYDERAAITENHRIEAANKANELAEKIKGSFDGDNIKVLDSYVEEVVEDVR